MGDVSIEFDGSLFEVRPGLLMMTGTWSMDNFNGSFILFRTAGSDTVEAPQSTTRELTIDDDSKGENIQLSADGQTAKRIRGYSGSICLSAAPLALNDDCFSYEVKTIARVGGGGCDSAVFIICICVCCRFCWPSMDIAAVAALRAV